MQGNRGIDLYQRGGRAQCHLTDTHMKEGMASLQSGWRQGHSVADVSHLG